MEINSNMAAATAPARGKSMQSVGQLAKMAVAMAREQSGDIAKNAQGVAASSIAKGGSVEGVMASLIGTNATPDSGGDTPVDGGDPAVADSPAPTTDPTVTGGDALDVPEVVVSGLDDPTTPATPITSPAAVLPDAPQAAVTNTAAAAQIAQSGTADDIAQDAIEMLFGQSDPDQSG